MGVSGTGKSTVGCRVAEELSLTFIEADDFHPQHNVQKMAGGTPLTDEDRDLVRSPFCHHVGLRAPRFFSGKIS